MVQFEMASIKPVLVGFSGISTSCFFHFPVIHLWNDINQQTETKSKSDAAHPGTL